MISVPLYIFLFAYFFFLLAWGVFFFVNVGHLVHTGTLTIPSFIATFLFIAFAAIVLFFTLAQLATVDWQQSVVLWNTDWLGHVFSSNLSSP